LRSGSLCIFLFVVHLVAFVDFLQAVVSSRHWLLPPFLLGVQADGYAAEPQSSILVMDHNADRNVTKGMNLRCAGSLLGKNPLAAGT
jgi:hypothetical protein